MSTIYKIHPSIGVARVGTSSAFYLTPETAGGLPSDPTTGQPVTKFRDGDGKLLKQAQRFRVFAYDSTNPNDPGTEVKSGANGVAAIEWTAYLANKKAVWYQFEQLTGSGQEGDPGYLLNGPVANPLRNPLITDPAARQQLILDPGPRTVGGSGNPAAAQFTLSGPATDAAKMLPYPLTSLGSIQLDSSGDLLVIGGDGASGTVNTNTNPSQSPYEYVLTAYANNDGWFDDVADGPVTAKIVLSDGTSVPVDVPAWCLSVPPKFAPELVNLVTLHDLMFDVAVREMNYDPTLYSNGAFNPGYQVDFNSQIAPFLTRPSGYQWVADIGGFGAASHDALPQAGAMNFPLTLVRDPASTNDGGTLMPRLAGDNPITDSVISKYLTITQTQYFLLSQWMAGNILATPLPPPSPAAQLDQAALDNCVGGAFCPGIEMTWVSRNTSIYAAPFRLRMSGSITPGQLSQTNGNNNDYSNGLEPGDVIKYMAQPWQADFNECSNQGISDIPTSNTTGPQSNFWWWPAERPYYVYTTNPTGQQVPWTRGFLGDPNGTPTAQNPNLGDMQMVVNWKDLGFVKKDGAVFIEVERNDTAINNYTPPKIPTRGGAPSSPPLSKE